MKKTHKLLTCILTLCMLITSFLTLNTGKETVQAAGKEKILVATYSVSKGVTKLTDGAYWYKNDGCGKFFITYSFAKKCKPNFMIRHYEKILYESKTKKLQKGTITTDYASSTDWHIGFLGEWSDELKTDVLSDKTVSGTVKVYFIPTCDTLSISTTELDLTEGSSNTLSVTAEPSKYAKNFSKTKWTSSKPAVAKVDKNGKVTAVSAGTATITAQVDSKKVTCKVTVHEKLADTEYRTATSMQLSKTEYNYTGKAKTPKVTVFDQNGDKLPKSAYEVTYIDNVNAGTATVKVLINQTTIDGEIVEGGFLSETFTIKPLKAKEAKLAKTSYDFKFKKDGIKPAVTVYDSKGKKIPSKEYTVTYKNNKEGGTAKAIIQMNQNYGNKTFTKEYKLNYNKKTNELLPKNKVISKYNGKITDVLYYTKQSDDMVKKLLPYGDPDIAFDLVYNTVPFLNEQAFFPNQKDGDETRQSYAEFGQNELKKYDAEVSSVPFKGSLSDLLKCVIHSPIKSVSGAENWYSAICEDGTEINIRYCKFAGMQYSKYTDVQIFTYDVDSYYEYDAIVNIKYINYGYE